LGEAPGGRAELEARLAEAGFTGERALFVAEVRRGVPPGGVEPPASEAPGFGMMTDVAQVYAQAHDVITIVAPWAANKALDLAADAALVRAAQVAYKAWSGENPAAGREGRSLLVRFLERARGRPIKVVGQPEDNPVKPPVSVEKGDVDPVAQTEVDPIPPPPRRRIDLEELGLRPGSVLRFSSDPSVTATVAPGNKVELDGETLSLSAAALMVLRGMGYKQQTASGSEYWTYEGEKLSDRRKRLEKGRGAEHAPNNLPDEPSASGRKGAAGPEDAAPAGGTPTPGDRERALEALYACLPEQGRVERRTLLAEAGKKLAGQKPIRKIRSALNKAIAAEVGAGRLEVDEEWRFVWRP
jgi:hypothetical protein